MAVVVFKDKKALKFMKRLISQVSDVKKVKKNYAKLLSIIVFKDIIDHFEKETGPRGKWKKITRVGQILQDGGDLRKGLIPIELGRQFRVKKAGILWFNPVPYAKIHDEGGKMARGGIMPQRSFMWLSKSGLDKISKQTIQFALKK